MNRWIKFDLKSKRGFVFIMRGLTHWIKWPLSFPSEMKPLAMEREILDELLHGADCSGFTARVIFHFALCFSIVGEKCSRVQLVVYEWHLGSSPNSRVLRYIKKFLHTRSLLILLKKPHTPYNSKNRTPPQSFEVPLTFRAKHSWDPRSDHRIVFRRGFKNAKEKQRNFCQYNTFRWLCRRWFLFTKD